MVEFHFQWINSKTVCSRIIDGFFMIVLTVWSSGVDTATLQISETRRFSASVCDFHH